MEILKFGEQIVFCKGCHFVRSEHLACHLLLNPINMNSKIQFAEGRLNAIWTLIFFHFLVNMFKLIRSIEKKSGLETLKIV